jgi:hypothetical protein
VQNSGWQDANSWTASSPLNGNTTYYWRVKGRDNLGNEGAYSTSFSFTTTDGWEYPAAGTIGPCVSPSLGDGVVYVGTGGNDDKLYCIDIATGTLTWSLSIGEDALAVSSAYDEPAGKYTVWVAANQNVYAYRDNGSSVSSLWSTTLPNPSRDVSEVIPSPDMTAVFIAYGDGTAYKLSNTDGSTQTNWPTGKINASVSSSPIVTTAYAYFGSTNGTLYEYTVDGTTSRNINVFGAGINTPLGMWNDVIYVAPDDDFLYAIDQALLLHTWTSPPLNNITATGPFTLGDGIIYVGAGNTLKSVTDNGASATVNWTYTAGGTINSTPITNSTGSQIYFGCDDNSAYGITSAGATIAGFPKTDAANTLPNTPAVDMSSGIVIYTSLEGKVYGYPMQ